MRFCTLLILGASLALAADDQQLALALRAQADFERVETGRAQVDETARCIQSQAAWLAVAPPTELSLVHFRKAYCTLAGAVITGSAAEFQMAAAEFEKAIETWPERASRKNAAPEPVSSGLRAAAQIARLETHARGVEESARQELAAALDPPVCASNLMPVDLCQGFLRAGRQWLGWMALQQNDVYEAARQFSSLPESPWFHWTAGRKATADRKYAEAAAQFQQAVDGWTAAQQRPRSLPERLEPRPDMPAVLAEMGRVELLAGEPSRAVASLDAALKADPNLAHAIYLRARAKEASGQSERALADYNLAARTALANDLSSGEAHLYRGIAIYRRKDYAAAEDEFASALNSDIPARWRADAAAWRHMAAVAGGACGASRSYLEQSLTAVSPDFPKEEARAVAASCPLTRSGARP